MNAETKINMVSTNTIGTKFKLLDKNMDIFYEGIFYNERLEKSDIQVDKITYKEIIDKIKYINLMRINKFNEVINYRAYDFSDYLQNTMNDKERGMIIKPQIIDKQGNKKCWKEWELRMKKCREYYYSEDGED